jgi:hypothetical protein
MKNLKKVLITSAFALALLLPLNLTSVENNPPGNSPMTAVENNPPGNKAILLSVENNPPGNKPSYLTFSFIKFNYSLLSVENNPPGN